MHHTVPRHTHTHRTFAAVVFTALSVGRASSFAPDASKAKISAGRVLALLRREPAIDTTSKDGTKPVRHTIYI